MPPEPGGAPRYRGRMRPLTGQVELWMDAPPEQVWDLVSDVTRIGEFSPETFEGRWTGGSTGPEVGARFAGHVKRNGVGPTYWGACTVTACEPGRLFEFSVGQKDLVMNNWGYSLAERDGAPWSPSTTASSRCCSCACTGGSSGDSADAPTSGACAPPWSA